MTVTKIFFILSLVSVSFACSCGRAPSLKEDFCPSIFVGIVKVVGPESCGDKGDDAFNNCYSVEVLKTVKGDDLMATKIITSGATCGQSYTLGTEYLITSFTVEDGFINTNNCDYHNEWSRLTDTEKQDIEDELDKIISSKIKC